MSDQIPSPADQKDIIYKIEEKPLVIGGKAAVISHLWFEQWKRYVGYNRNEPENINLPPINIKKLFKDGKLISAKIEGVDYDIIHTETYNLLVKWFTGDSIFEAPVIENENGKPVVLLRYNTVKLHYKDKVSNVEIHRYMKISEVLDLARKTFEIPKDTKIRLFGYLNLVVSTKPLNEDKTVGQKSIVNNEDLLVDSKNDDEHWDSESLTHSTSTRMAEIQHTTIQSSHGGLVGLHNLGNTCFFNSGTQCLMHTVPLMKFMLGNEWEKDLNPTNPIGMKGKLAKAFAQTAQEIWLGSSSVISPSKLKSVIGQFAPQFSGWGQQDSHELILFMLDGIHEDLNRCKNKENVEPVEGDGTDDKEKAIEAWKRHKKRNDSIIVDLFHGQLRSQLDCPNCQSRTVVFDPYLSIPMPINRPHTVKISLIFVPYDFSQKRTAIKIEVSSSNAKMTNELASQFISEKFGREIHVILGSKTYTTHPLKWGYEKINYAGSAVYAFELPDTSDNHIYLPCEIHMQKKSYSYHDYYTDEIVGTPFLVDLSSLPDDFDAEEAKKPANTLSSDSEEDKQEPELKQPAVNPEDNGLEMFEQLVYDRIKVLWEQPQQEPSQEIQERAKSYKSDPKIEFTENQKMQIELKKEQKTVWHGRSYEYVKTPLKQGSPKFQMGSTGIASIHLNPATNYSIETLLSFTNDIDKKKSSNTGYHDDSADDRVNLHDCFEYFSTMEQLDENNKWFCPKCRQFVCASKKLDIWSVPEIMVIQLKRFVAGGIYTTRKLETMVDFPDVLDMKDYVIGPQKDKQQLKYKLFAVSIHMGGLGGGHYTAAANVKDPNGSSASPGSWYYFNDSSVSAISSDKAHTQQAYVLFYERMK